MAAINIGTLVPILFDDNFPGPNYDYSWYDRVKPTSPPPILAPAMIEGLTAAQWRWAQRLDGRDRRYYIARKREENRKI